VIAMGLVMRGNAWVLNIGSLLPSVASDNEQPLTCRPLPA
jgi:hypothetical protein